MWTEIKINLFQLVAMQDIISIYFKLIKITKTLQNKIKKHK